MSALFILITNHTYRLKVDKTACVRQSYLSFTFQVQHFAKHQLSYRYHLALHKY